MSKEQSKEEKDIKEEENIEVFELASQIEEVNSENESQRDESNHTENLDEENANSKTCSARIKALKTDSKFNSLLILLGSIILFFGFYVFDKHSFWAIICFSFSPLFLIYGSYLAFHRFFLHQRTYFHFQGF
ncbi:leukocyte antigen cd37 [Anaeramoeba ignava]|uniref:Leukocyte antigen cd37 n=1 Tax=Anaeramoeba ignava TaxID=1746090 RepID=A0A9Q0L7U4_ANAIG|nr:leukocyte antigen cd37 [Anaeramoeba ignava]|eukprot:Anaeramoba_ignava/a347908_56.p2 GENE.a347908_56~~a347908_56.p2  ORF type:complete len:132 (-),score=42.84 a347908_56:73-468(-)